MVIFQNVSNVGIRQIGSYIENVKLLRILNSDNGSNFENRLFGMNWIWAFLCQIGQEYELGAQPYRLKLKSVLIKRHEPWFDNKGLS